ncbi:Cas10/Cmr2 second palm domain-containing protein [Limnospira sp. PMC 1042.18]|uniref:Cas10/Cmr2 second palm domain-containing protein n=2 Tax=Sirenicapillariaceae TaxID=2934961 RepID=UPI0002804385|nr:hypothetical protein [Limnospira sp. PMC 1042.18]EKD07477.1 hypothetical protein SPLC1_S411440 [Arthrospira platensis C1]MDT9198987.1 hypothetical protein [Limnospira sp. PMC 1042.18]UWU47701.1 hypothetical protein APLC1_2473 [Arthrospira platensis C1]
MARLDSTYYLVLIETSGNQGFIFSTNKLKENIGASEVTYRAGTQWILEAVAKVNQMQLLSVWTNSQRLREMLCDEKKNPPIKKNECQAEIIIATSGKALILTKTEEKAREIISKVTKKALVEAPGLDIAGVFVTIDNWQKENSLAEAIREVHKCFEKTRSRRPSPESRFLRLPIIADCAVSGLPAFKLDKNPENQLIPISKVSDVKREASTKAIERLQNLDSRIMRDINKLEKLFEREETSWLAIVHADGNGLGQIFLNFEDYIGKDKSNRTYIHKYRKFSLELDECTEAAFKQAIEVLPSKKENLPLVPLIVGGDDLTVVCDGYHALEFTRVFLQEFEKQTQEKLQIAEVAQAAFGVNRLSACAGISIVKRHFPFSVAYELAESLIKSAKDVKRKVTKPNSNGKTPFPCSAIDFHILYDTSGIEFDSIREKLERDSNTRLYNRPYIVSDMDDISSAEGKEWAKKHEWERLSQRVDLLNRKDSENSDRPPISSSQSHAIRTALFIGKDEADAQYALIRQRYNLDQFAESEDNKSLFYETTREKDNRTETIYITSFLDALDAQEFLKNEQTHPSEQ